MASAAVWVERSFDTLLYSERVRYVDQLRRYHEVFAPEQVLVLIYDDFRDDNESTVRTVLRFLEVDDSGPIELVRANPTVSVRSLRHLLDKHGIRGLTAQMRDERRNSDTIPRRRASDRGRHSAWRCGSRRHRPSCRGAAFSSRFARGHKA